MGWGGANGAMPGGKGHLEILAGKAQRVARTARRDLIEHDHEQRLLPRLELETHLLRVRPSHLVRARVIRDRVCSV